MAQYEDSVSSSIGSFIPSDKKNDPAYQQAAIDLPNSSRKKAATPLSAGSLGGYLSPSMNAMQSLASKAASGVKNIGAKAQAFWRDLDLDSYLSRFFARLNSAGKAIEKDGHWAEIY